MPKVLVTASSGANDPTRASIPFHIAVNGIAAVGADCGIALAGDATELVKRDVAAGVRGVGIPALADLLAKCRDKGLRFYV
jgi:predicted peroxiredoxin